MRRRGTRVRVVAAVTAVVALTAMASGATAASPAAAGVAFVDGHRPPASAAGAARAEAAAAPRYRSERAAAAETPPPTGTGPDDSGASCAKVGCQTCVYLLERIKAGKDKMLPAMCSVLYAGSEEPFKCCQHVLKAVTVNANNVRSWLQDGCYKHEVYMHSKEWIRPCPSHVICSALTYGPGQGTPLCKSLKALSPFDPANALDAPEEAAPPADGAAAADDAPPETPATL